MVVLSSRFTFPKKSALNTLSDRQSVLGARTRATMPSQHDRNPKDAHGIESGTVVFSNHMEKVPETCHRSREAEAGISLGSFSQHEMSLQSQ